MERQLHLNGRYGFENQHGFKEFSRLSLKEEMNFNEIGLAVSGQVKTLEVKRET